MTGGLGWQPSPAAWLALLGAALAAGVAVSGYRRARFVRFARTILAFRLAALLLLAISAFAPTLELTSPVDQKRLVLCVLDDSLSMAQIDQRPGGQSLRVAEALGLIAPAAWAGDGLLDQARQFRTALSAVEEARAQRDQARLAEQPVDAEQKILADLSAASRAAAARMLSAAQGDAATRFAAERIQRIVDALADNSAALPGRAVEGLIDDLERHQRQADAQRARQDTAAADAVKRVAAMSRYDLAVAATAQLNSAAQNEANQQSAPTVVSLLDGITTSVPPPGPTRPASPITSGLATAVERAGAGNCECVILLSDGRSTEARPGLPPALLAAGVPIYTVELAAVQSDPDVRIAELAAPPTALVGEAVPVRVVLQNRNAAGTTAHITLSDGKTSIPRDVTLGSGQDVVNMTWPAAALPSLKLSATVDVIAGERQQQNNRAEASVTVVDQKLRITLVAGSAGWDLQYLRNALARSPWVLLRQQILEPGEKCRLAPGDFASSDVVILCDLGPAALDGAQCDGIRDAVSKSGKSALLLPGDVEWFGSAARQPSLAGLVPQRIGDQPAWRLPPSETPTVQPVPSPGGELLPLLRSDDAPDTSLNRWVARPRFYRYVAIGELKPQARPLLVDRVTQMPLIVEQSVGSGRAMALLTDETWRWRAVTGAEAGDRFWLELVRGLVDPPMSKTQGGLSLGIDRDPQPAGRAMTVRARVPAELAAKARLSLSVNGKTRAALSPAETFPGSGRLTATFTPDTAGPAELLLKAGDADLRLPLTIADSTGEEIADTAGDPALLNRIAQQSGGMMVPLEGLSRLPPQIALRRQTRVDTIHLDLWSNAYWFAAVVACLGLEWALRKLAGMV